MTRDSVLVLLADDAACNAFFSHALHDSLPIFIGQENRDIQNARLITALFFQHRINLRQRIRGLLKRIGVKVFWYASVVERIVVRSEEHTSELQSRFELVCRLPLATINNNKFLH